MKRAPLSASRTRSGARRGYTIESHLSWAQRVLALRPNYAPEPAENPIQVDPALPRRVVGRIKEGEIHPAAKGRGEAAIAARLSAWIIAFPKRPSPVESSEPFRNFPRGVN